MQGSEALAEWLRLKCILVTRGGGLALELKNNSVVVFVTVLMLADD